jgi:Flp pilus assembly protein CpaB
VELEYKDTGRRAKVVVVVGVILAIVAGGAAYFLITQAQQQAGQAGLQKVAIVVATRAIPARKVIEAADVAVAQVPVDPTNANGVVDDPAKVIGRVPAVTILEGQPVTTNLLASSTEGGQFSILGPDETIAPDSPAWRAISITVADDQAVGGMLQAGETVDVFVTATVNVPQDLIKAGKYYTDKSTKVVYQDMLILARTGGSYILKTTLAVAEEIAHLQASGTAQFSMALRPDIDTRQVDATALGETTNRIITKYGLPIPETYPAGNGPVVTLPPLPSPTPFPSPSPLPSPSTP